MFHSRQNWAVEDARRISEINPVFGEIRDTFLFIPLGVHSILHA